MALPLTTFRGTLKQLDPSDSDEPARTNAFRWAFPAFLDPLVEDTSAGQLSPYQKIKPRRRRFSGGQFTRTTPLLESAITRSVPLRMGSMLARYVAN